MLFIYVQVMNFEKNVFEKNSLGTNLSTNVIQSSHMSDSF